MAERRALARWRCAIVAGTALLAGCGSGSSDAPQRNAIAANATQPVAKPEKLQSLDDLLTFKNPGQCAAGGAFERLMADLAGYDRKTDKPTKGKLTLPAPFQAQVGPPTWTPNEDGLNVKLPMRGLWHGLEVTGLELAYWDGGDPPMFVIAMRAPKAKVQVMLEGLGFKVATDADQPGDPSEATDANASEFPIYADLTSEGETTWFSCAFD